MSLDQANRGQGRTVGSPISLAVSDHFHQNIALLEGVHAKRLLGLQLAQAANFESLQLHIACVVNELFLLDKILQ